MSVKREESEYKDDNISMVILWLTIIIVVSILVALGDSILF